MESRRVERESLNFDVRLHRRTGALGAVDRAMVVLRDIVVGTITTSPPRAAGQVDRADGENRDRRLRSATNCSIPHPD
jgi:hypothetical protein